MSYYDTPSDEIFEEIKNMSVEIWKTYDDTYGYASEKISYINSISNYKDNWGSIVGMFDSDNQQKLLNILTFEAREMVSKYL